MHEFIATQQQQKKIEFKWNNNKAEEEAKKNKIILLFVRLFFSRAPKSNNILKLWKEKKTTEVSLTHCKTPKKANIQRIHKTQKLHQLKLGCEHTKKACLWARGPAKFVQIYKNIFAQTNNSTTTKNFDDCESIEKNKHTSTNAKTNTTAKSSYNNANAKFSCSTLFSWGENRATRC